MQHVSATTHEMEDNDNVSGGDNDLDDDQVNCKIIFGTVKVRFTYIVPH